MDFEKELQATILNNSLFCNHVLKKISSAKDTLDIKQYSSFQSSVHERTVIKLQSVENDAQSVFLQTISLATLNKDLPYLREYSTKLGLMFVNKYRMNYTIQAFQMAGYTDYLPEAFKFYLVYEFKKSDTNDKPNVRFSKLLHRLRGTGTECTIPSEEKYIITLAEFLKLNVDLVKTSNFVFYYKYRPCNESKQKFDCELKTIVAVLYKQKWYVGMMEESISFGGFKKFKSLKNDYTQDMMCDDDEGEDLDDSFKSLETIDSFTTAKSKNSNDSFTTAKSKNDSFASASSITSAKSKTPINSFSTAKSKTSSNSPFASSKSETLIGFSKSNPRSIRSYKGKSLDDTTFKPFYFRNRVKKM